MSWRMLLLALVCGLVGVVPAWAQEGGGEGGGKPSGCICGASDPGGGGAEGGGGGACLEWCKLNGGDGKTPDLQSMQDMAKQEAAKQGFEMGKNGVMQQMQSGQSGGSDSGSSSNNYYNETQQANQYQGQQTYNQFGTSVPTQGVDSINGNGGTYGSNYQATGTPNGWSDGGSIGGGSVFDGSGGQAAAGSGSVFDSGTGGYQGYGQNNNLTNTYGADNFTGQVTSGANNNSWMNAGTQTQLGQSNGFDGVSGAGAQWGNPAQASLPNTPQVQAAGQGGFSALASEYNGPSGALPQGAAAQGAIQAAAGTGNGVGGAGLGGGGLTGGLGNAAQQLLKGMTGQGGGGMNGLQALSSLGGMLGGGGGGSGSGSSATGSTAAAGSTALPVTAGSQASAANAQGCYYNYSNTVMCPQGTTGTSSSGCAVNPESRAVVCPLTSSGTGTSTTNAATQASQANAQGCYYNTQQMIMCPKGSANTGTTGCATNPQGVVMCPQVAPAATSTSGISPQLLYQAGYLDAERGNGRDPRYANDPVYKRGFDDALAEDASSVTPTGQDASDRVVRERCADGFGRIATDLNVERGLVEVSFLSAEELDDADYDLMDKYSTRALVLMGQMKGVYDSAKRDAMYGVPFEQSLKDEVTYVEGYACGRRLVRQ